VKTAEQDLWLFAQREEVENILSETGEPFYLRGVGLEQLIMVHFYSSVFGEFNAWTSTRYQLIRGDVIFRVDQDRNREHPYKISKISPDRQKQTKYLLLEKL
jgi:hypothetical protein